MDSASGPPEARRRRVSGCSGAQGGCERQDTPAGPATAVIDFSEFGTVAATTIEAPTGDVVDLSAR